MLMESIVIVLLLLIAVFGFAFKPDTLPFFAAVALLGSAITLIVLRIVCGLNLVAFVPV
jgi:hypothetical protein